MNKSFSFLSIIPNLYYVLFLAVPLFMSSKTSEIFEFNKMILIYLFTVVITTLYLLHITIRREKIMYTVLYVPLLVFLLSQILSTLFSIDIHTSIFGYYGRWNGGLVSIISYLTLFYIGVQTFTYQHVKRLLTVSLIASALVMLWGLPGKFGPDVSCYVFTGQLTNTCWTNEFNPSERMFSTLGQPNWLGAYLAIHFFIGWYFLYIHFKKIQSRKDFITQFFNKPSLIYSVYLLVNLFVVWFTKSRSALIAITAGILIGTLYILFEYSAVNKKVKKIVTGIVAVILVSGILWAVWSNTLANIFSLPAEATAITDSFEIRKVVWKGAIDLGNKYPFFGSGVETFAYAYYFTRPLQHNFTSEWDFIYNKAHNEFLNYFATTGYFGLISYVLIILTFFTAGIYYIYKSDDKNKKLLIVSILLAYLSILITNFFGFSVSSIQIFFYILPVLVVALTRDRVDHGEYALSSFRNMTKAVKVRMAVILFMGFYGIYSLYNYYSADILYAQARQHIDNNEYTEAYTKLTAALSKKYEHIYEDKLSSTAANLAFLDSFTKEKILVAELISLSKRLNDHTLQVSKNNVLYLRTKGKNHYLYYQTNHSEEDLYKAVKVMEEAVRVAKSDVQSRYTLALFYYIASQELPDKTAAGEYLNKTRSSLEEIIRMKPNYIEAQELYTEVINKE